MTPFHHVICCVKTLLFLKEDDHTLTSTFLFRLLASSILGGGDMLQLSLVDGLCSNFLIGFHCQHAIGCRGNLYG